MACREKKETPGLTLGVSLLLLSPASTMGLSSKGRKKFGRITQ
jgi:hypothetical protein